MVKIEYSLQPQCSELVVHLTTPLEDGAIRDEIKNLVKVTGWKLGCTTLFWYDTSTKEKFVPLKIFNRIYIDKNDDTIVAPTEDFDLSKVRDVLLDTTIAKKYEIPLVLPLSLYNPRTRAYLSLATECYRTKALTVVAEQHCTVRDFPGLKKISEYYGVEPVAYDGGNTEDYENWLAGIKEEELHSTITRVKKEYKYIKGTSGNSYKNQCILNAIIRHNYDTCKLMVKDNRLTVQNKAHITKFTFSTSPILVNQYCPDEKDLLKKINYDNSETAKRIVDSFLTYYKQRWKQFPFLTLQFHCLRDVPAPKLNQKLTVLVRLDYNTEKATINGVVIPFSEFSRFIMALRCIVKEIGSPLVNLHEDFRFFVFHIRKYSIPQIQALRQVHYFILFSMKVPFTISHTKKGWYIKLINKKYYLPWQSHDKKDIKHILNLAYFLKPPYYTFYTHKLASRVGKIIPAARSKIINYVRSITVAEKL